MSPATFSFKKQKEFSDTQTGELLPKLIAPLSKWMELKNVKIHDMKDVPAFFHVGDIVVVGWRGHSLMPYSIELKIESRTSAQTPNLAIERYSSKEKPGGPFSTSAVYYAHYFADGLFCIARREALTAYVLQNSDQWRKVHAANPGYSSTVYLVPRVNVMQALGSEYAEFVLTANS